MLRGRSPWGLGGAVYLLVFVFVRVHLFVDVRGRRCFLLGVGGCYRMPRIHVGSYRCLVGEQLWLYCEGVPSAVVFEISPSHVKTFHYPPQYFNHHHDLLPAAVRRLCVGSAESKDQQVRRPHHVQVQSPISRTILSYIYKLYNKVKTLYKERR